ncbi:MAG: conjugal transfer protein TraG N-terminal domain-containing protein [Nitrospiria bacterium]
MPTFDVFAYGNGSILVSALNAIVLLIGDQAYLTLLTVTGLIGTLVLLMEFLFSQFRKLPVGWIFAFAFLVEVALVPKANVIVHDVTTDFVTVSPSPPLVSNVPLGLALLAHFATTTGKVMTDLMETAFADPAGLNYSNNGLGFSQNMISSSTQNTLQPGFLKQSIDAYIENCVVTDLLVGNNSATALNTAPDLWAAMASLSGRVTTVYTGTTTPFTAATMTCSAAYPIITTLITAQKPFIFQDWLKNHVFSPQITTPSTINAAVTASLGSTLMNSYAGIGSTGYASAQDIVFQTAMIHQLQESVINYAAVNGSQANLLNLGIAQADAQTKNNWLIGGELAKKYLPMVRGMIEGFLYGLFPIAFLLMITPAGGGAVKMFILGTIWVESWGPLFSILNHFILVYAAKAMDGTNGVSMSNLPNLNAGAQDMLGILGLMGTAIPMVALGLIKMGGAGVDSFMGGFSGAMSGATGAAGAMTATGNLSMGNAQVGNMNYGNRTAFQSNLASSWSQGDSASYMDNVRSHSTGSSYNQGSNSGLAIDYTDQVSRSLSTGASNAASAVSTNMKTAGSDYSAAFSTFDSMRQQVQQGSSVSNGASSHHSAGVGKNYDHALDAAKELSKGLVGDESKAHDILGQWSAASSMGTGNAMPIFQARLENSGAINDKNSASTASKLAQFEKAMEGTRVKDIQKDMSDYANSKVVTSSQGYSKEKADGMTASFNHGNSAAEEARNANTAMQQFEQKLGEVQSGSVSTKRNGGGLFDKIAETEFGLSGPALNNALLDTTPGHMDPRVSQAVEATKNVMAGETLNSMGLGQFEKFLGDDGQHLIGEANNHTPSQPNAPANPEGHSVSEAHNNSQGAVTNATNGMPTPKSIDAKGNAERGNVKTHQGGIGKFLDKSGEEIAGKQERLENETGTGIERLGRTIPGGEGSVMVNVAKGGSETEKGLLKDLKSEVENTWDRIKNYKLDSRSLGSEKEK